MRIAYMLTSLGIGGAERQVTALAERMCARGHAVKIVVLTPPATVEWTTSVDVMHLNLRKTALSAAVGWMRAARLLRKFRPDILHCHNFHGNLFGRLLKPAVPGMRIVSTVHNVFEGGWLRMQAYRATDALSRRTIAVCEAASNRMVDVGAVPRRKCISIANGVNVSDFAADPGRREKLRVQMGAKDYFIWITAGRIVPAKNYENLLRAFAWVHASESRCALWIAGEGNGEYADLMRSLATELKLERAIRWLGLRRDVAALLDAADGFVLASAWEGMPIALGEAMAMEKPVVAADVGGVRELVGPCGEVVLPGDAEALARGMFAVMRTALEERNQVGKAASRRIAERFSMDSNADAWEAIYRSVLLPRK